MMMKFVVPYDEDDYGDTDVWHSLIAALQQFRQFLLIRHFSRRCSIFFGCGLVIFPDLRWEHGYWQLASLVFHSGEKGFVC